MAFQITCDVPWFGGFLGTELRRRTGLYPQKREQDWKSGLYHNFVIFLFSLLDMGSFAPCYTWFFCLSAAAFLRKSHHIGGYFISPLRINGSAIESIYSVLKFASGAEIFQVCLTVLPSLNL